MPTSFSYTLDKFWGIGNDTPETGTEGYYREDFDIQLEVQVPPLLFFSDCSGLYWITITPPLLMLKTISISSMKQWIAITGKIYWSGC